MTTTPSTPPRKWHPIREAAEHFGVARVTLWRLIRAHKLPAIRVGRVWRVDLDRLERALNRMSPNANQQQQEAP